MEKSQRNISNAKLLLENAMPSQNYELMRQLLTPDATIISKLSFNHFKSRKI